jgi:type I restriction enzyme S subunit
MSATRCVTVHMTRLKYVDVGVPLVTSKNIRPSGIDFSTARNISPYDHVEISKRSKVDTGDVLFSMIGSVGHACLVDTPIDFSIKNVGLFKTNENKALPKYVFYWLCSPSISNWLEANMKGGNQKFISLGLLRELPIIVAPLNEQKRIADKLDTVLARVDACRERLDRVPAILKRFRQSVLAAATSGKLTEEWREQHCVGSNFGFEWEPVTLNDLCENSFYGPRFGRNEYTDADTGVPTIRTTDMTDDGRIEITKDTPRVLVPSDKLENFRARKGDLLVTRTGSIGMMAVFEGNYLAIPSAYLIRFRFSLRVLSRYVFFCLMAPYGQERLGLSATAITQPNINAEAIKRIEIQLPHVDEQHEIVRRIESLFAYAARLEARYTAARAQVERLTPALLAKAFRGELVPQDPNDEPAAVLLERIRAAREAAPAKSRQRKGSSQPSKTQKAEVTMLDRKDIQDALLR